MLSIFAKTTGCVLRARISRTINPRIWRMSWSEVRRFRFLTNQSQKASFRGRKLIQNAPKGLTGARIREYAQYRDHFPARNREPLPPGCDAGESRG